MTATSCVPSLTANAHAARLLEQLKSGQLSPASITAQQSREIVALCRGRVDTRKKAIERQSEAGRPRATDRERRALLACLEARLLVAAEIHVKRPHEDPGIGFEEPSLRRRLSFVEQWRLAEWLRRNHRPIRAIRYAKRKRSGGFRFIYRFAIEDKARQRLYALALRASASFHPRQYTLCGGRSAVCGDLHDALLVASEGSRFVQLDISDFYGSISHEWLEENLPFPTEDIRRFIHTGGLHVHEGGRVQARQVVEENPGTGRRGIPQGSAVSPVIAEMIMADVLRSLADQLQGLQLIVYSDNIGIVLAPIGGEDQVELLRNALLGHAAGPFRTTTTSVVPITSTFRFMGYDWRRLDDGNVESIIPPAKLNDRVYRYIDEMSFSLEALERTWRKCRSYFAAFSRCPNGQRALERLEEYYIEQLSLYGE